MTRKLLGIAVVLAPLALADRPIATVSTGGSLTLNGTSVPNAGVSNWPVAAGDEIATSTAPAVITFADGTQVSVGKGARVRLLATGATGVDLLAGTAAYKTGSVSKLNMQALGHAVDLQSRAEGVVSVQESDKSDKKVVVRSKTKDDDFEDEPRKPKDKPKSRSGHEREDGQ